MNKKLVIGFAFVVVLALSACGPSEADIQAAIQQTQAAIPTSTQIPTATTVPPTPTATPISLSEINLEPLLILDGDLPAGFSGSQIRERGPKKIAPLNSAVNTIYQQFEFNGEKGGGVAVYLFESQDDLDRAFAALEKLADTSSPVDGLGEASLGYTIHAVLVGDLGTLAGAYTTFTRCGALVEVAMDGTSVLADATSYAERLDERLKEALCRPG